MDKKGWKKRIKSACQEAGTYRPYFDYVIDSLAGIMEMRDSAQNTYDNSGRSAIVTHTNKSGQKNIVKHPALVAVMDCNQQALAYWRDLGLTPSGLRKIDESLLSTEKQTDAFAELLAKIGE